TRFSRDWSSDVCSSDLNFQMKRVNVLFLTLFCIVAAASCNSAGDSEEQKQAPAPEAVADNGSVDGFKLGVQMWTFRMFSFAEARSEERRVGEECVQARS